MDYKKLAGDLLSYCHMNCADCEYAVENEFECTIARLSSTAITELLSRAEEAETRCETLKKMVKQYQDSIVPGYRKRAETAEEIAIDLCDDFTDFVTGGVHNAAPYCANCRPECVNAHGWCDGDNRMCRGFMPKAAVQKNEK